MNQLKRCNGQENAITLIALVITIIVLLILAGVTIVTLTGDNGIMKQTQNAKEQNAIGEEKEKIKLAILSQRSDQSINELTKQGLQQELANDNVRVLKEEDDFIIQFTLTNRSYKIGANGEIEGPIYIELPKKENAGDITIDGYGNVLEGTTENPYQISCVEDLMNFSARLQNTTFSGKTIVLTRNINIASELSYVDASTTKYGDINENGEVEELITELTTGKGFTPLKTFEGTFDGRQNEIQNLYINRETESALFTVLSKNGIIKNLGITGVVQSTYFASGIVTYLSGGRIDNCYNKANITGKTMVGGIIAQINAGDSNASVKNCINYGEVKIEASAWQYGGAGGITGCLSIGEIENCSNRGKINGEYRCGGISGTVNGSNLSIKNCENYGEVNTDSSTAGGIVGFVQGTVTILNSINFGAIQAKGVAGGMVGSFSGVNWDMILELTIMNSANLGTVISQATVGGIVGNEGNTSQKISLSIENCYQTGRLTASSMIGGILGSVTYNSRTDTTVIVKNNYYLDTTASIGINASKVIENMPIAYNSEFLKSTEFIELLNSNRQEHTEWLVWKQGEDNFPVPINE